MRKFDLRKDDGDDGRSHILDKEEIREKTSTSRNNIKEIITDDFRGSIKNPIVIIVLIAVIILPSLYGLVNIYACWDPYENTGNVEFAVANDDHGATFQNYSVNAGEDLVDSLKSNNDFKWVFISSDELRKGVHNGTYYAGIVIPSNFSESVVSITTDDPHAAELEYIVNEKSNPVAAKLTDAGAKAIYNKLNAEIVSFIDAVAYGKLGELQSGLASGADKLDNGAGLLSEGADQVASGAGQLKSGANQVSSGSDQLASGAELVSDGATTLAIGANQLSGGADEVAGGASQVADGTQQIANRANEIYEIYLKVKKAIEDSNQTSGIANDIDKLDQDTSNIAARLSEIDNESRDVSERAYNLYNETNNLSDNAAEIAIRANNVANKTHNVIEKFNNVSAHLTELNNAIKNNKSREEIQELLDKIDKELNQTNQNINALNDGAHLVSNGSESVAQGASQLADGSSQLASGSSELASGANELSSGVHVLANGTIELADGAELLGYSSASALRNASNEIGSVADQLSTLTGLDDDQVENYFYSPVVLKRHEEFPTSNYGSQVAPFYIVLSMWVGALITSVMLKTGSSVGTKYNPHEVYISKLLLFTIMALLQTTITLIGCFGLGIDISNPLLFIFSCYFVAVVFMGVIYSLISLFGDVGKGVAILLLVFQISGSGGVYPVEIMNTIFGILYPYLPMTHGINIVRESQLGLIGANYLPSFIYLWILGLVVIIGATLLKQKWDKRTKYFDEKLEESNLFN